MTSSKIILVRHGHVEGIKPEKFRGRVDLPLTDLGTRQARKTAQFIASQWKIDNVYSSPLQRSLNTACAIAEEQKLTVQPLDQLMDIDYGDWQGRTLTEVSSTDKERFELFMKSPQFAVISNGESLSDVQARVVRALHDIRQSGGTSVIVGHDSVNRIFLILTLGVSLSLYWQIKQDPCAINVLNFEEEGCRIECMNSTAHLI
jgi:phosphoserine phosphatase